ncbi:amidase [Siccirubricoccus deserti]|uniref:Amidase n=1 Tax=Siccirubricoccus deserti TaxID=2013562 RepID=A0A9X0UDT5_9PROT|nr:amidase [Siccirubricoccus deserti]MBC4015958.1 amidase [Siccirubricoccus deserti]GGC39463.1 amidase [Siccirubricoccus deserti]
MQEGYRPDRFRALTWHDATPGFASGADTPRAYLERCLETIAAREPVVQAWAARNEAGARAAADASTARWREGRPLSPIDGMPIGIKDLLETKDMPTEMGCVGYRGNFPKRDNAAVWALRQAGAVVLGKTVTTELGGSHPGPTTNPFDPRHTPGGSSSGSAAAVGARMVPAAIGTQVGGSIIRPAAYCGNVALKPTQGGIHRGERQTTSMSTHGVHAGCVEDMWQVAIEIAARCGGDPGRPGLLGPPAPPPAAKPLRLVVMETEGWAGLDAPSRTAFEALLERIAAAGITLLRRADHPWIESFEQGIAEGRAIGGAITGWENRWYQRALLDQNSEAISPRARAILERAEAQPVSAYQAALARREEAQQRHARIAPLADAAISLACPGPAPVWDGDRPGQPLAPRPTGDAVFNLPSSLLFAPAVTVPLLAVGGLPVGVQVMGQMHQDARMTALARWLLENVAPVVV